MVPRLRADLAIGFLRRKPQGNGQCDDRPTWFATSHRALATAPARTFAHSEQAERGGARCNLRHADAIIGNIETQVAAFEPEPHVHVARTRVTGDVGERL